MSYWFTTRKREKVIGGGIHNSNATRASIVRSITGKGCCDVEELVPASEGM
ncbi:hypothetical protein NC651_035573 [Populus alba x Populus x berolinensis]|nr:hypothetical protein NC651_035573 [Populus alba x Populus x berolinensis]